MGNARNLARLVVDSGGDVDVSSLGNVPPSNDASALTTGTLGSARLPAGTVVQVVSYQTNNTISTSSTSYIDSGILVAITPKFSSSKMVIILSLSMQTHGSAGPDGAANYNLVRDTTQLQEWRQRTYSYNGSGVYLAIPRSTYIDTPATTNPITYKVQLRSDAAVAGFNSETSTSSIVVMEVSQ